MDRSGREPDLNDFGNQQLEEEGRLIARGENNAVFEVRLDENGRLEGQFENDKVNNLSPGGGGNLSFQDTGLCHSNRESTTHKSGKPSQKYTLKSGEISQKYTHKSGVILKIIPINPGMPKKLTNN